MDQTIDLVQHDERLVLGIAPASVRRPASGRASATLVVYTRLPDTAAVKGLAESTTLPSWVRTLEVTADCAAGQIAQTRQVMFTDTWRIVVDMSLPGTLSAPSATLASVLPVICSEKPASAGTRYAGMRHFAEAAKALMAVPVAAR